MAHGPGRPGDFERLLAESDWLQRLARGLVRDLHDADDLVQDSWVAALRRAPAASAGGLRAWLSVVARNFSLRQRRDKSLRSLHEPLGAREEAVQDPESIAARVEMQRELAAALLALEEPYRSPIVLRYFDGLSTLEVARELEITHANARQRISRGLAKLRARLDGEHGSSRAWILILEPLAGRGAALSKGGSFAAGWLAMTTTWKLALCCLGAALALTLWIRRSVDEPAIPPSPAALENAQSQASEGDGGGASAQPHESRTAVAHELALAARPGEPASDDSSITGEVRDSRGARVPGAAVVARVFGDSGFQLLESARPPEGREVMRTRADDRGEFRLEVGPRAVVQLDIDALDRGACVLGECRAGEHVIATVLAPGSIRGRVTRAVNGEAFAGARVDTSPARPDRGEEDRPVIRLRREAPSDASGTYLLEGLPPGKYEVRARLAAGGLMQWRTVEVAAGAVVDCNLELGEPVRIHGSVRDALTQLPIEGAQVSASWNFSNPAHSDANGEYELVLAAEFVRELHARAAGHGVFERSLEGLAPASGPVDFELQRARRCRGVVLSIEGAPIAGAYVAAVAGEYEEFQRIDWRATTTDVRGEFEIGELRADLGHSVFVRKPGFGARIYEFPATESERESIDLGEIRLAPELEIAGAVQSDGGAALPNVKLVLRGANRDRARWNSVPRPWVDWYVAEREGRSDAAGRFSFVELSAGSYRLDAFPVGSNEPVSIAVTIDEARSQNDVTLIVPTGLRLAGFVKDAQGRGVPDAYVSIEPEVGEGRGLDVPTDARGHFEARGVPVGNYTLRVWPGAAARNSLDERYLVPRSVEQVAAGEQELEIVLEEGAWLRGRVFEGDGTAAANVFVEALDAQGEIVASTLFLGGAAFKLGVRRGGVCTLQARRGLPAQGSPEGLAPDFDLSRAVRMPGVVGGGPEIALRFPLR